MGICILRQGGISLSLNEPHGAQDGTCNAADVVIARADIRGSNAEEAVDATEGYEEEIRLVDIEAEPDEDDLRELSCVSATHFIIFFSPGSEPGGIDIPRRWSYYRWRHR